MEASAAAMALSIISGTDFCSLDVCASADEASRPIFKIIPRVIWIFSPRVEAPRSCEEEEGTEVPVSLEA